MTSRRGDSVHDGFLTIVSGTLLPADDMHAAFAASAALAQIRRARARYARRHSSNVASIGGRLLRHTLGHTTCPRRARELSEVLAVECGGSIRSSVVSRALLIPPRGVDSYGDPGTETRREALCRLDASSSLEDMFVPSGRSTYVNSEELSVDDALSIDPFAQIPRRTSDRHAGSAERA
jgi:hypothetical protein